MELTRTREREGIAPPSHAGAGGDSDGMLITLSSWPYCEQAAAAGLSVGEIRRRFLERMDIDPLSTATLDVNEVDAETIVQAGQVLMFVRRAGEKGSR
jgi:hypothetical protein